MKSTRLWYCAGLVALIWWGCGGSSPKTLSQADEGEIPSWYLKRQIDLNYLLEPASETSQDLDLAVRKAQNSARQEIARVLESRVVSMQKRFQEESGTENDTQVLNQFTNTSKLVVSTCLSMSSEREKSIYKDGKLWRAYVLMQLPVGQIAQQMAAQIKKNTDLFTKVQATQAFKELDEQAKKWEESKEAGK